MMNGARISLLFAAILIGPNSAFAEQYFSPGTDGERIESSLSALVETCMGAGKYTTKFLPNDFTVSNKLKNFLIKSRDANRLIEGVRFDRLARTVFDGSKDISIQLSSAAATSLPLDIRLPESTAISDASNATFGMTCGTSLKLALDQGFSLPYLGSTASVKQALNIQSNTTAKNSLLLSYGTFWSPLYLALSSNDPAIRSRAHAAVLGYYLSPEASKIAKPVAIKSIVGWLMTEGSNRDISSMLKASAGASGSMWGLSADISSDAQLEYNTKLSSGYFTIILKNPIDPSNDTAPLPTISEISGAISDAARFPEGEVLYTAGVKFPLTAYLYGVPAWLCGNQWKAETSSKAIWEDAKETYNANDGICSISFYARISSAISSLDVTLKNSRAIKMDGKALQVEIRHSYPLNAQSSPKIVQLDKPMVTGDKNSNLPSYVVEIPFNVYPAGRSKEVSARSYEKVVLDCPGYAGAYTSYAPDVRIGSSQRPFIYAVPITFSERPPAQPCALRGKVDFTYLVDDKTNEFTEELNAVQIFFPSAQQ